MTSRHICKVCQKSFQLNYQLKIHEKDHEDDAEEEEEQEELLEEDEPHEQLQVKLIPEEKINDDEPPQSDGRCKRNIRPPVKFEVYQLGKQKEDGRSPGDPGRGQNFEEEVEEEENGSESSTYSVHNNKEVNPSPSSSVEDNTYFHDVDVYHDEDVDENYNSDHNYGVTSSSSSTKFNCERRVHDQEEEEGFESDNNYNNNNHLMTTNTQNDQGSSSIDFRHISYVMVNTGDKGVQGKIVIKKKLPKQKKRAVKKSDDLSFPRGRKKKMSKVAHGDGNGRLTCVLCQDSRTYKNRNTLYNHRSIYHPKHPKEKKSRPKSTKRRTKKVKKNQPHEEQKK